MPQSTVQVRAPSRLHLGLFSARGNREQDRRFGGVGVMVDSPAVALKLRPAEELIVSGQHADRARDTVQCLIPTGRAKFHLHVEQAPRRHVGLGLGTQLAMAVAAGCWVFQKNGRFRQAPIPAAEDLAVGVGRGLRSAVGAYGFVHGGLIIEEGKTKAEDFSPLLQRVALPDTWRAVLFQPPAPAGLFGRVESNVFETAQGCPKRTQQLVHIARQQIARAAQRGEFSSFASGVYEFGYLAGQWFSHVQGGAFNGPAITDLIARLRSMGVQAVGQSSWGPTVFAFCPSQDEAESIVSDLEKQHALHKTWRHITRFNNSGASITISK